MTLARLEDFEVSADGNLSECAVAQVAIKNYRVKVILPLEGLVNFDEEIKRIEKTVEKLQKDINILNQKLSNEKFVANADEDVIPADRLLLEQSKSQITSLQEALIRFQTSLLAKNGLTASYDCRHALRWAH